MTLRFPFRLAVACAASFSLQALAQPVTAAATDADIAAFQADMEVGCVKRGIERQQPENEVRGFCTCMTATLRPRSAGPTGNAFSAMRRPAAPTA